MTCRDWELGTIDLPQIIICWVDRTSSPESVAQKVEGFVWVVSPPVFNLAVDNLGLLRCSSKPPWGEGTLSVTAKAPWPGLHLCNGKPLHQRNDRRVLVVPPHPHIEPIAQKEIRQKGTN